MKIKLFATSDVHGNVSPYKYSDRSLAEAGLARLATYIRQHKDEDTILIDNGDLLQGSPLCYHHHLYNEEDVNPVVHVLNELDYDYFNIGNHDFNYGQEVLYHGMQVMDAKCITTNITDGTHRFEYDYVIHQIKGVKIALVGLTNDYIPNWEIPSHITGLSFENAYTKCASVVEKIKKNNEADYIVVVYHGGFEKNFDGTPLNTPSHDNQGYRIVSDIEGIDVLITGHQHRTICQNIHNTFVTQTAQNGMELAHIEIDTDTREITGQLILADSDIDQRVMGIIQKEEEATQTWLDEPVGGFDIGDCLISDEMDARIHKHSCVSFLNQIQKDYYQADCSASALFNDAFGFNHQITMRDIVSTYVYPNTIIMVKITGKNLKAYLEQAAKYFDVKDQEVVISKDYCDPKPIHYEYDMVDGVDYVIKVGNPVGERIENLMFNGKEIAEDQELTFVVNNYRLAGGGNYTMLDECEVLKDDGKEMVEIIAEYIMKNNPVVIDHKDNIKVIV